MQSTREKSKMARGIRDLERGERAVWIPDEYVDMSIFAEYPKEREGIAVYYEKNSVIAYPVYVRFYRSPKGMSIELADEHEYRMQEKERIGFLLRRGCEM